MISKLILDYLNPKTFSSIYTQTAMPIQWEISLPRGIHDYAHSIT